MSHTLFISDLHLDPARPATNQLFVAFLDGPARGADALYILGDLFEFWVGDDQPECGLVEVLAAIKSLSASGCRVYFSHGNRDFLVGVDLAGRCGFELLAERRVVDLYGRQVLVMHGDTLCTDDHDYQRLRVMLRNPAWQQQFLSLSVAQRIGEALKLREASQKETRYKDECITDVNAVAVVEAMRTSDVTLMIHGHTHRPAIHHFSVDGKAAVRIVLGDWYEHGSVLTVDSDGSLTLSGLTLGQRNEAGFQDMATARF